MGPPEHHSLGSPLPRELDAAKVCHRLSLYTRLERAQSGNRGVVGRRSGHGPAPHRHGVSVDSAEAATELRHARRPLEDEGESYVELTRAQLVAMDGAYDILPDGIHAVYAPGAACGDSQGFARALVDRLRAGGATVLEGQPVTRLLLRDGRVIGAESAAGRLHADAVILAAGVGTRKLARRSSGTDTPCQGLRGDSPCHRCWRGSEGRRCAREPARGVLPHGRPTPAVDGRRDRSHRPRRDRTDEATAETSR